MDIPLIADITARIKLLRTARGGRDEPLPPGEYKGVISARGQHFSFRCMLPEDGGLGLGESVTVDIEFVFPDLALPIFRANGEFNLWEGGVIGYGRVLKVRERT
ncbi:hypothetical protein KY495_11020 [Massilia sp. PAMC28688]|uniref:hypothetical protein n=1 Tax=Massilia sp. PAMC28688 TaxID=2861283 RepID=UPI001C62790E|nr:hypothetical protein [Massilia sp. PAMC28688]QYF95627.1 hypothetical protein KY495_11020 [Massilia sp. PAMC28688]